MNKFYHYARYRLGLSPLVNGTGFAVSMSVLKEANGWHSDTLTEDIEFSIENIIKGRKIGWASDAIVYDEQPQKFSQSFRQRLRWSVGHIQCFHKFFREMIAKKRVDITFIDAMIYILGMPMFLVSVLITLIDVLKVWLFQDFTYMNLIFGLKFTVISIFISILQALLITLMEKKNLKKVWKGIATYPLFLLSWFVINAIAFFNTKLEWKPIAHVGAGHV